MHANATSATTMEILKCLKTEASGAVDLVGAGGTTATSGMDMRAVTLNNIKDTIRNLFSKYQHHSHLNK